MTIQLSEETEAAIALRHTEAAQAITGLASGVPGSVDGGYGAPHLMEILSVVVATADDIALINEVAAAQVTEVGASFGGTDDAVADGFRRMKVDPG